MTLSMSSFLSKKVSVKSSTDDNEVKSLATLHQLQDYQNRINWNALVETTFQTYVESGIGRLIIPTETMLKVYFLQYRYGMLATGVETALNEIDELREFALLIDVIPKATSIRAFAHLLKDKNLSTTIEEAFIIKN